MRKKIYYLCKNKLDRGDTFYKKSTEFYKAKLVSLVLLFMLCFTGLTSWSQIVIDGDPADWPAALNNAANVQKAFRHDPFNQLHIDDQWTGGSQDNDPINNWHWVYGNSNDK